MNTTFLKTELINRRAKPEELAMLCSKFAIALSLGMGSAETAADIADGTKNIRMAEILKKSSEYIMSGMSLAASLRKSGETYFPEMFYETVKAGEEAGCPDEVFGKLSDYYGRKQKTSKQIKSALIYPAFVLALAAVVLIVVMIYVIPSLTATFLDYDASLPMVTKILVGVSEFFRNNIGIVAVVSVLLIMGCIIAKKTVPGLRELLDRIKLRLPLLGKICFYDNCAGFAGTLFLLLDAGVQLPKAIRITGKTLTGCIFSKACEAMAEETECGNTLFLSMKRQRIFPKDLSGMVRTGEKSGGLEEALDMIGKYYSGEADLAVKSALAKLEPILMTVVAGAAGFIVMGVYLPIFKIYGLL